MKSLQRYRLATLLVLLLASLSAFLVSSSANAATSFDHIIEDFSFSSLTCGGHILHNPVDIFDDKSILTFNSSANEERFDSLKAWWAGATAGDTLNTAVVARYMYMNYGATLYRIELHFVSYPKTSDIYATFDNFSSQNSNVSYIDYYPAFRLTNGSDSQGYMGYIYITGCGGNKIDTAGISAGTTLTNILGQNYASRLYLAGQDNSTTGNSSRYTSYLSYFDGPVIYPSGYEGELVEDGSNIDADGDGLNLLQEMKQGTSDNKKDTDGDGVDDLKESIWFPDRDEVFCDTTNAPLNICTYPDPLVKDIYIEIDWMQNSSRSFKPNATQVNLASLGLDGYNYNIHIDTGEYGGGNALPYITDLPFMPDVTEVDYFDLKNGNPSDSISANFNPKRKGIWRYIISGYNYSEYPSSIGGALPGSDNIFISFGLIQDSALTLNYSDFDTAIAGTIVHETGHSLCLSRDPTYSFQSSACQFSGIDEYDTSLTYDSVMNYSLMVFITHLSYGNNGSGDHDDWDAINTNGISDFNRWEMTDIITSGVDTIRPDLTLEQAKDAQKNGSFGKIKRGNEIYDYRQQVVRNTKTGKTRPLKTPL